MALGGGTFTTQNKILPGSYINIVSSSSGTNVFGERGTGALGMDMTWYTDDLQTITNEDFQKNSLAIFGFSYSSSDVKWVRDFFKNGKNLIFGALNTIDSKFIAKNTYCSATHYGSRGEDLMTVIQTNADDTSKYDVITYLGTAAVDTQTVSTAAELEDNDWVTFNDTAELAVTAGTALVMEATESGTITEDDVQAFLTKLESYSFNAVALGADSDSLLLSWTKRMRDEVGIKFQCITCNKSASFTTKKDYEGCVDVIADRSVLPWVCGALAGCEINKSLTNSAYDGESYDLRSDVKSYSQADLEDFIENGGFAFHLVGDEVRVLMDINSLVSTTEDKGEIFKSNQTIRVCDQIANDIAEIFNNYYLGKIPNDEAGRSAFRAEIVKHHNKLMDLRAIEDFTSDDVAVSQGDTKRSVVVSDSITVVNAMEQLYMTVIVQ